MNNESIQYVTQRVGNLKWTWILDIMFNKSFIRDSRIKHHGINSIYLDREKNNILSKEIWMNVKMKFLRWFHLVEDTFRKNLRNGFEHVRNARLPRVIGFKNTKTYFSRW
jgi:hypothetical protein